jgi:hypothetical protein
MLNIIIEFERDNRKYPENQQNNFEKYLRVWYDMLRELECARCLLIR